jgi:protein SCO1/2
MILFSLIARGAAPEWPSDSLHHLPFELEMSDGHAEPLAATAGRVRVVSMFYASCPMVCPLTFETIRQIERSLTAAERPLFGVVVVSVDPARDTPGALHALAKARHVDDKAWRIGRASPADTRALAAALGIQFRALENGDFNHSTVLVLLDPQGRIVGRSSKLGAPDPEFIQLVRRTIARAGNP